MAVELVEAKYTIKDADGNPVKDAEGKPTYAEASANYDFGNSLADLIAKCGEEVTFSNAVANMRVSLQSRIRALHKANPDPAFIQSQVDQWIPGVVAAKVAVDPVQATLSQFANWPKEKQREFLKQLQGK